MKKEEKVKEEDLTDFELFSKYFLYDEVLDTVFNRVHRARASAFQVSGFENDMGNRVVSFRGKSYQGHRIAYLLQHGEWPKSYLCTKESYLCNNTGCRNVSYNRIMEKFVLNLINKDGESKYCGAFLTVKAAAVRKEYLLQTDDFKRG